MFFLGYTRLSSDKGYHSHSFVCSVNSVICGLCGAFLCRFVSQISVVSTVYREIVVKIVVSNSKTTTVAKITTKLTVLYYSTDSLKNQV